MIDIVDPATRSRMMAAIKGKDTRPEVALRKALHALGLRFRLHNKRLPGRPDIVLPKWKTAIFVHGCFWHRHPGCRYATSPATRAEFWTEKFAANVARDQRVQDALSGSGWRVRLVWECELRSNGAAEVASNLEQWLRHDRPLNSDR